MVFDENAVAYTDLIIRLHNLRKDFAVEGKINHELEAICTSLRFAIENLEQQGFTSLTYKELTENVSNTLFTSCIGSAKEEVQFRRLQANKRRSKKHLSAQQYHLLRRS